MTLPEVLVALAVLALLGTALVEIFHVAGQGFQSGAGRIMLQQRAREAIKRIVPIVSCAVPANDTQDAVLSPAVGEAASRIELTAAEDLLFDTPFDPRVPVYRRWSVEQQGDTLVLARLTDAGTVETSRVLARGLDRVTFTRLSLNSVRVDVQVRGTVRDARFRERQVTSGLQTVVQVPYYAMRP